MNDRQKDIIFTLHTMPNPSLAIAIYARYLAGATTPEELSNSLKSRQRDVDYVHKKLLDYHLIEKVEDGYIAGELDLKTHFMAISGIRSDDVYTLNDEHVMLMERTCNSLVAYMIYCRLIYGAILEKDRFKNFTDKVTLERVLSEMVDMQILEVVDDYYYITKE